MRRLWGLLLPFAILIAWQLFAVNGKLAAGLMPAPNEVWEATIHLLRRGLLIEHLTLSFVRVVQGFGLAALLGIPCGILLGVNHWLRKLCLPLCHFLRQIPPIAWVPLFLLWLGLGEGSKLAVIVYAAFFPILLNTLLGVEQIARSYWEVAEVLEFSRSKYLVSLVMPASAPSIFTGLRLGMGMSWRALVAAEMIAASSGLGYLIMSSRSLVRVDEMVVGMLSIGVIGVLIDKCFELLEKILLPWNSKITGRSEEVRQGVAAKH